MGVSHTCWNMSEAAERLCSDTAAHCRLEAGPGEDPPLSPELPQGSCMLPPPLSHKSHPDLPFLDLAQQELKDKVFIVNLNFPDSSEPAPLCLPPPRRPGLVSAQKFPHSELWFCRSHKSTHYCTKSPRKPPFVVGSGCFGVTPSCSQGLFLVRLV